MPGCAKMRMRVFGRDTMAAAGLGLGLGAAWCSRPRLAIGPTGDSNTTYPPALVREMENGRVEVCDASFVARGIGLGGKEK